MAHLPAPSVERDEGTSDGEHLLHIHHWQRRDSSWAVMDELCCLL